MGRAGSHSGGSGGSRSSGGSGGYRSRGSSSRSGYSSSGSSSGSYSDSITDYEPSKVGVVLSIILILFESLIWLAVCKLYSDGESYITFEMFIFATVVFVILVIVHLLDAKWNVKGLKYKENNNNE